MAGVAIGVSLAGVYIDYLIANGNESPYTAALLGFTVVSLIAIPLFYGAGRRYEVDKARLQAVTLATATTATAKGS